MAPQQLLDEGRVASRREYVHGGLTEEGGSSCLPQVGQGRGVLVVRLVRVRVRVLGLATEPPNPYPPSGGPRPRGNYWRRAFSHSAASSHAHASRVAVQAATASAALRS